MAKFSPTASEGSPNSAPPVFPQRHSSLTPLVNPFDIVDTVSLGSASALFGVPTYGNDARLRNMSASPLPTPVSSEAIESDSEYSLDTSDSDKKPAKALPPPSSIFVNSEETESDIVVSSTLISSKNKSMLSLSIQQFKQHRIKDLERDRDQATAELEQKIRNLLDPIDEKLISSLEGDNKKIEEYAKLINLRIYPNLD